VLDCINYDMIKIKINAYYIFKSRISNCFYSAKYRIVLVLGFYLYK